jgi:16S rRNA (guanine527-N7)-methyltransferase
MDRAALVCAAQKLGIALDEDQCEHLEGHVALLERWNRAFNLVSRGDMDRVWTRHVLDSLTLVPVLRTIDGLPEQGLSGLDVGTGAGFPGLPLAVVDPSASWVLLDRNSRKIRFLDLVIDSLGLTNVTTRCCDLAQGDGAVLQTDLIVSRGVDGVAAVGGLAGGLLRPGGVMVLCTRAAGGAGGNPVVAEVAVGEETAKDLTVERVMTVDVPGLDRAHELTIIRHA